LRFSIGRRVIRPFRMRKRGLAAAAILPITLVVTGFASASSTTVAGASSKTPNLSGVTLVLGEESSDAGPEIEASGVLKGAPYKVQFAAFQGPAPAMTAMLAGDTDATIDDGDVAVALQDASTSPTSWTASNAPIRVIALEASVSPNYVTIATKKSGITNLSQVKGHTFAYDPGSDIEAQYLLDLAHAHLKQSDVTPVIIQAANLQSTFATGATDVESTASLYAVQDVANGTARIIANQKEIGFPGLDAFIATHKALANPATKAALSDFLLRLEHFNTWYPNHIPVIANILESQQNVPAQFATQEAKLGETYLTPFTPTLLSEEQTVANTLAKAGVISHPVTVAPDYDTAFNSVINAANKKYGVPKGAS
jgi:sulfonate transport system substrate-binding protein